MTNSIVNFCMKFFFKRKKVTRYRIKQAAPELFFVQKDYGDNDWWAIDVAYSLEEAEEILNILMSFPKIVKEIEIEK